MGRYAPRQLYVSEILGVETFGVVINKLPTAVTHRLETLHPIETARWDVIVAAKLAKRSTELEPGHGHRIYESAGADQPWLTAVNSNGDQ